MLKHLIHIIICLALASCVSESTDFGTLMPEPTPTVTDTLEVGQLQVAISGKTGTAATRATTTVLPAEEAEKFYISIFNAYGELAKPRTQLKDLDINLPVGGGYKLTAESCLEDEAESALDGWGKKRYVGTSDPFRINKGEITKVPVCCSVANAGVEVYFDESIKTLFTSYSITINDANRNIVFDKTSAGEGRYSEDNLITKDSKTAYFNVSDNGTRTITYTLKAEGAKSVNKQTTRTLEVAKMARIWVHYEVGHFTLDITYDDKDIYYDQLITIRPSDVKGDDGTTDASISHDGFSDADDNIDINDYGH